MVQSLIVLQVVQVSISLALLNSPALLKLKLLRKLRWTSEVSESESSQKNTLLVEIPVSRHTPNSPLNDIVVLLGVHHLMPMSQLRCPTVSNLSTCTHRQEATHLMVKPSIGLLPHQVQVSEDEVHRTKISFFKALHIRRSTFLWLIQPTTTCHGSRATALRSTTTQHDDTTEQSHYQIH